MSTPSTLSWVTPMAPLKSGAVLPGGAYFWIVWMDWVTCCVPPPVSKLKLDSPTSGSFCSGAT